MTRVGVVVDALADDVCALAPVEPLRVLEALVRPDLEPDMAAAAGLVRDCGKERRACARSARDVPYMPTHGVPTAAARCSGPVSDPMKIDARRAKAASSIKFVGGARMACPWEPATI